MVLALVLAVLGLLMLVVPWPFLYVAGARRGGGSRRAGGEHGDAAVRVLGALLLVAALLVALANG